MPVPLQTPRLRLVPATVQTVAAEINDRIELERLLQAQIPANWPPESAADALPWFLEQLQANPTSEGWWGWYGIAADGLIGGAGFKGPPASGEVETGYSLLPEYQRQGYATEMVGALVEWALGDERVQRVVAETTPDNLPSIRLLERLQFHRQGIAAEPNHIRFVRLRHVL